MIKQYELNGVSRNVPTGFSWTTFFFGPFPALFRGDLKWAAIQFVANIGATVVTAPFAGIGGIAAWLTFAFIYNDRHEQDLKVAGWKQR